MSGQTQFFKSSSRLDTCPYLRGRDDVVWAMCVPVAIAGRTTGVLHMQRPVELPPGDSGRGWELIARKAGDRLGMLRAFARSETQARTDPLTGLLNRRSLEARTRDLTDEGHPFVVAYGDLDHFKLLNDTHGHDTGDRALRVFSETLRHALRTEDVACRYGGEEFVILLPGADVAQTIEAMDRIRDALAHTTGRGDVPSFTASFGIAHSSEAADFEELMHRADQALFAAKDAGRDRVCVDGQFGPLTAVKDAIEA
jgi:diguanylate cyclase (GGDEF)-like protein